MLVCGKKILLLFSLLYIVVSSSLGGEVTPEMAQKFAVNFYFEKASNFYDLDYASIKIKDIQSIYDEGELQYYVINFTEQGFLLLAADDHVFPVLGYSFESNYLNTELPPAFSALLSSYKNQISHAKQKGFEPNAAISKAWNKYLEFNPDQVSFIKKYEGIAPLLSCNWGQKYLYNAFCPVDPAGSGGHASAGCVAIALAQLIYYFRFPDVGEGSFTYESGYGIEFADFGNTHYNWNDMVNTIYNMPNPAIAELIYHAGVSVEMNYGPNSSSANVSDTRDALVNYFKYGDEAVFIGVVDLGEAFNDSLIASLDKNIPLIYRGGDIMMSHAFVCDGYQDSSYFHFNWGWEGQYNGYFNIDTLAPGGYDLTFNQSALFNVYPRENYPTYCVGTDTLKTSRGTFVDGSGSQDYENNINCRWLIAPQNQNMTNIQLWFSNFDTELNIDIVTVYDGPTEQCAVLATFSGSDIPPHITSSGNEMLIVFQTNETITHNGWLAEYIAYSEPFCNPLTTYTDTLKMWMTDASGPYNYLDNSDCQWLIAPESNVYDSIAALRLFFHKFGLADDDTLFIFDGDSPYAPILVKLTGDLIPEDIESTGDKLFLQFITNEANTGWGWAAGYRSILPVYCQDTIVYTAVSGVIEDGSGIKKYVNNANCFWLIAPEEAEVITITFEEFDLEHGYDQLKVYDATGSSPIEIANLWGHQIPEPITLQGNKMLIRFITDNSVTFDGWKISYTSLEPYVNEQPIDQLIDIFPNPVGDQLYVNIPSNLLGCKYTLLSISGEIVEEDLFTNELNIINTGHFRKGIYCIKIVSDRKLIVQKFIK